MKDFTEEFDKIKNLIVSGEPFGFSRFSDGEVTILQNNVVVLAKDYFIQGDLHGDDVKFSVMSYTISTANDATGGDLSAGVENCVSPATVTSAGYEQAYYQALTVSTADVDAGKIILACVAQDGTNADLSINMQLVYHLR